MDRPAPDSVWVRTVVGWHVAFWLMMAITALAVVLRGGATSTKVAALAGVAVLSLAYRVVVVDDDRSRRLPWPHVYLAVLTGVVALLAWLPLDVLFLLFIAYPQVWFLSDRRRDGVVWTVVLTAAVTVALLGRFGWSPEALRGFGPAMLVSLLFSVLLGLWIASVIDQSQERADLIAELDRARGELAQAHHAAGVVAERERVAQEIHDTLAQGFTSIVALAQAGRAQLARDPAGAAGRLEVIEDTARENLAEARALVAAFAPVALRDGALPDAIRRLADRFTAETGLPVELDLPSEPDAADGAGLPRDAEVVLLRAAQEALTNVRRHAGARTVRLRLAPPTGGLPCASVEVVDDGRGMDPADRQGLGLTGMRHRVEGAGGSVHLDSAPGRGTRVLVTVPTETPGAAAGRAAP
ncbi:sensor histidine kinase [Thalassiella azotivora]